MDDNKLRDKLKDLFMLMHAPEIKKHITLLKNKGSIPDNIDEAALVDEAMGGLFEAAERYNHEEPEAQFTTLAGKWLRGKMLDHVVGEMKVPKHLRQKGMQLKAEAEAEKAAAPNIPESTAPEQPEATPAPDLPEPSEPESQ